MIMIIKRLVGIAVFLIIIISYIRLRCVRNWVQILQLLDNLDLAIFKLVCKINELRDFSLMPRHSPSRKKVTYNFLLVSTVSNTIIGNIIFSSRFN